MRYIPGNAQNIGAREEQQDAFGFSDPEDKTFLAHGGFLGVLADGMGGMQHGGGGSLTAVRAFLDAYQTKPIEESVPDALVRSLYTANRAVLSFAASASGGYHTAVQNYVGTTIAAAVALNDTLYWISAGDSRIYLLREGRLTALTADHIYANHLDAEAARGEISRSEALNHPEREGLTSYLGLEELSEIDHNIRPFPLQTGDRIIACSDGLYRSLSEDEIASTTAGDPQRACEDMVERALAKRIAHQDNITVLTLWCEPTTITIPAAVPALNKRRGPIARRGFLYLATIILLLASGAAFWWWLKHSPAEPRNPEHNSNQNSNDSVPDQPDEGDDASRDEQDTNANSGRKSEKEEEQRDYHQPPKLDENPDEAGPTHKKSRLHEPIPFGLSRYQNESFSPGISD